MVPNGPVEGVPPRFVWHGALGEGPRALVLLDAGYDELARVDDIGASSCQLPARVAAQLAAGGTFHWFVVVGEGAGGRASRLESFEIR